MRDVVKLLLRPVSVLSLGLSTMGMMVRVEFEPLVGLGNGRTPGVATQESLPQRSRCLRKAP